jgi:hypothetical protein
VVGPRIGVCTACPHPHGKDKQKKCLAHPAGEELRERRTNLTFPRHIQSSILTSAASYRTVFTDYQTMSRKIPNFRHVIPNAFVDLPELGDASPQKIHSKSTRSLCSQRHIGVRNDESRDFSGRNPKLSGK